MNAQSQKRREITFEKWQGLGNDFIVVDDATVELTDADILWLCDRRFGVGGDGVLLASKDPMGMVVRNADGTRPEMCGNGLRCVAGWLGDAKGGAERELVISTDSGPKACVVHAEAPGKALVTVGMGRAQLEGTLIAEELAPFDTWHVVNMGNPHAVRFGTYEQSDVDRVGPLLERTPQGGTNVEFCEVETAALPTISVTVWERGVGRTLACGTGACAVVAAACREGLTPFGTPVAVRLPGGTLMITVAAGSYEVEMEGPAVRVFSGRVPLP